MRNKALFYSKIHSFFTTATLVGLLVVVIAGSLVKATDSGMGCPDWPKCFGHLVPPTDPNEVHWNTKNHYFEGQMVIHQSQLWTANSAMGPTEHFIAENWTMYDRHNYAIYNPTHTIIEYINRLATVLLGLFALGMLLFSFTSKNNKKLHVTLAVLTVLLIGFEAWLGRLVVDSELSPLKISIHLYAAFLLVFIMSIHLVYLKEFKKIPENKLALKLIGISLGALLLQLFLGTKLREIFDHFYNELLIDRNFWIDEAGIQFLVHRSFSLVYAFLVILSFYKVKNNWDQNPRIKKAFYAVGLVCIAEIFSGIIMTYFEVPRAAQPIHVFFSASLLAAHTFLFFDYQRSCKTTKI